MDQPELKEGASNPSSDLSPALAPGMSSAVTGASALTPQSCPTCGTVKSANNSGGTAPAYIYALGKITPRFPTPAVEKEFAQAVGRDEAKGLTDPQVLHKIASQRQNRYLVRKLCWVMTIEGLDTYILMPRDPADFDLLIESLRPTPQPGDLDLVIGMKGPIASPELCNGLMVPIVVFDQLYSFDRKTLISAIPRDGESPRGKPKEERPKERTTEFESAAEELFDRIMQLTDNSGATDEHRALNYLVVRYQRIYQGVADAHRRNESLSAVEVQPSPLSGTRKVVDVIFSFTNRDTDVVSKQFVRVDVTEEFPYLVSKLSPYYDR